MAEQTRQVMLKGEELAELLDPVMRAIATAVGPHCEVVLHDLRGRHFEHSIIRIYNGQVSGRSVGGPSTNLGLELMADESADHNTFGYLGRTADGRDLHCSSVYFRDDSGAIQAALCINVDITGLQQARAAIDDVLSVAAGVPREIIPTDIRSLLDTMIEDAIGEINLPVAAMSKQDRVAVIAYLDERGAFHVKRSMEQVAKRLTISRVTGYTYLDEARRNADRQVRDHPLNR